MSIAYYNGDFCYQSEIRIPLTDRSIFFGDGIYDAAIGKNGKIYLEKWHIERFFNNANLLSIPIYQTKEELSELLHLLIRENGFDEYFIYFQLSRSGKERKHTYSESDGSNLLITIKPYTPPPPSHRVKLSLCEDVRYHMCNIKTLNLLPSVLASQRALTLGSDEVIFHRGEIVTECAHSNVFIVKDGIVFTHPESELILPGITRARLLLIANKLGIKCELRQFTLEELKNADEVIISATGKLAIRASHIDGKQLEIKNTEIGQILVNSLRQDYDCLTKS